MGRQPCGIAERDDTEAVVTICGTMQDITERAALEAQHTRLARLLDEVSSEIYVLDAATLRFSGANAGALRNLGYSLEELSELTPLDLKREHTLASFTALLAPLRTGAREQVTFESIHRRKDGSTYPVEVRANLLANETPPAFVEVIQDITDRVAANEERAWLASAVEQTAEAVWMQDVDGIVMYANRSFSRLYGYESDEIVGRYAGIVNSGRHEPAFFDAIWASVAAGKTWSGSIVNRRKDGTLLELEAVISGIRDADGRLVSYMQTDRDVTRERALENALAREARERETIEAALGQIDPADTPEAIAATACAEIVRLPEVDSAWAIGLWGNHGRILAAAGRIGRALAAGSSFPAPGPAIRERALTGPWAEVWQTRPEEGSYGEAISASGLHTAVFVPLKSPQGVVGVMGFGVHDAINADRIIERLPALATFGAIVGALVGPGLEVRNREDDARASVQAILDAAAFTPFFQPIVEFPTGSVVGYEALSRFRNGIPPDAVFALAVRAGLGIELEFGHPPGGARGGGHPPAPSVPELERLAGPHRVGRASGAPGGLRATNCPRDHGARRDRRLPDASPRARGARADRPPRRRRRRRRLRQPPPHPGARPRLREARHRAHPRHRRRPRPTGPHRGDGLLREEAQAPPDRRGSRDPAELEALRGLAIGYGQGYLLGRPQDSRAPGPWPTRIALPAG